MLPALFGIPPTRLMHAVYGAIRTRALVILRRRLRPVWEDPLHAHCPRVDFSGEWDGRRIWVLAANQRQDLVRGVLAELSARQPAHRPHLIIVACDPASRDEFATRAQDWNRIFHVGLEIWLPDEPPAPAHLLAFCRRLAQRSEILLSPAEALFQHADWIDDAFGLAQRSTTGPIQFAPGNAHLHDADRVPIAAWPRRIGHEAKTPGMMAFSEPSTRPEPALWASVTTERLPALTAQPGRRSLQGWLYRHKEVLLDLAARILLVAGLPRHKSYVSITECFAIPGVGCFITGSVVDPFRSLSRITVARPPDGQEIPLEDFLSRVPQPTVDRLYQQFYLPEPPRGFVALIPLEALGIASPPTALTLYEYRGAHRRRLRPPVQLLLPGTDSLRTLLASVSVGKVRLRELLESRIAQPVGVLWGQRPTSNLSSHLRLDDVLRRYGMGPSAPSASVVVPLYGRWDFMRYQLAAFSQDPTLRDVEWIYVVDDPRIAEEVGAAADALHAVFGVPFSLITSGANLGFSGASNLGARAARGPLLLLMNSDVFPIAPGWLTPMTDALTQQVAAVGARLLYEDRAIQHSGMGMDSLSAWGGLNVLTHPGKGLPDRLVPAPETEPCPAVTAACLLIRTDEYKEIGGLSEQFAIGDFEDGDLCARLRASGRSIVTASQARLYHLERQSIPTAGDGRFRELLTLYNCWLFNGSPGGTDSSQPRNPDPKPDNRPAHLSDRALCSADWH